MSALLVFSVGACASPALSVPVAWVWCRRAPRMPIWPLSSALPVLLAIVGFALGMRAAQANTVIEPANQVADAGPLAFVAMLVIGALVGLGAFVGSVLALIVTLRRLKRQ